MKSKNILKIFLASLAIFIPLYPKFPLLGVSGTFVSIRLEDFMIATTCFIFVLHLRKEILKDVFKLQRFVKYFLIYVLVGGLSVFSAVLITKTTSLDIAVLHLVRRVEYFSVGFMMFYYLKKYSEDRRFFISLLIPIVIYLFIYGFGQRYFSWPIIITQNQEYSKGVALSWVEGSHINSTFAGHYDLATFLVLIVPIFVSLFYFSKKIKEKIVYLFVYLVSLWLLVYSASRISLVSYFGAASLALIVQKKFKEIIPLIIVSLIFINFSSNLLTRYSRFFQVARDYFSNRAVITVVRASESGLRRDVPTPTPTPIPKFEDRSTSIRLNVEWPRAVRALFKNPLLGTGYSSITLATDNDYLRLLGETGILGFLSFMLVLFEIIRSFLNYLIRNDIHDFEYVFIASLLGGACGVMVNAVFIDIFEASKFALMFWFLVGTGLSIVNQKSNYQY